ncbi:hypothetical protein [Pontibacter pamirensis]|uniref:hypothetical protein n=1 Tax=Pontibacter pamirensis TaxID=2562824 RepID=UPI001389459A|nr:hypothetical protein [Pontibacter pamirensis]
MAEVTFLAAGASFFSLPRVGNKNNLLSVVLRHLVPQPLPSVYQMQGIYLAALPALVHPQPLLTAFEADKAPQLIAFAL